jgi:hypothetical protein
MAATSSIDPAMRATKDMRSPGRPEMAIVWLVPEAMAGTRQAFRSSVSPNRAARVAATPFSQEAAPQMGSTLVHELWA